MKTIKIILCGNSSVGKTSLFRRLKSENLTSTPKMTIGIDINTIYVDDEPLIVWDFGGNGHFRFLQDKFCAGADIAIIMFSRDIKDSFSELNEWLNFIRKHSFPDRIVLIENKIDLTNCERSPHAEKYAKDNELEYFKISTLSGEGLAYFKHKLENMIIDLRNINFLKSKSNYSFSNRTKKENMIDKIEKIYELHISTIKT